MWHIWVGASGSVYISRGEQSLLALAVEALGDRPQWFEWGEDGLLRRLA